MGECWCFVQQAAGGYFRDPASARASQGTLGLQVRRELLLPASLRAVSVPYGWSEVTGSLQRLSCS